MLLRAQGTLTPPGTPAPTMKTLTQIEPRTPISSAPFTITNSGSYYLTTNLTVSSGNAIAVDASDVTLDLNGFVISSTAPSATDAAIMLAASKQVTNVTILNGSIRSGVTNDGSGVYSGSGFSYGIYRMFGGRNVRISHISVVGCRSAGIFADYKSIVEFCTVNTVGGTGISATIVSDSTAEDCGGTGVNADDVANNCSGSVSASNGTGVYARTANNCNGYSSGSGIGVSATIANNCYGVTSNSGTGVHATIANNCYGLSPGSGTGLSATTANNCIGSNSGGSGYGIDVSGVATGCTGYSGTGTGVHAFIANACHGIAPSGTTLSVTHNINSF
jgi:hypothetical protein